MVKWPDNIESRWRTRGSSHSRAGKTVFKGRRWYLEPDARPRQCVTGVPGADAAQRRLPIPPASL